MKFAIVHNNYDDMELVAVDELTEEEAEEFYFDDNNIEWFDSRNGDGSYTDCQVYGACEHDPVEVLFLILEYFNYDKFKLMQKMDESCGCFSNLV